MAVIKKRHWAFVAYPESLPSDWLDRLCQSGLPCAISPLHDRDIDPTGETKKPHYHVILCYSGPTALSVVSRLTSSLGQPNPTALESVRGYYRYLTHKDNPDKAQYSESDIKTLNGFDIRDFVEMSRSELLEVKTRIVNFIRDNDITEYSDLINMLIDADMVVEWDTASCHTIFFDRYITSRRHDQLRKIRKRYRQIEENAADLVRAIDFYGGLYDEQREFV